MIVLLIAAIAALFAGVMAILIGIPVKEFSFGNTMILAGVMTVCTAMILFGLWIAVRELRAVARQMSALPLEGPFEPDAPAAEPAPTYQGYPSSFTPPETVDDHAPLELPPQPVQDSEDGPEPKPAKTRRNLMFESSMRKDRERAAALALQNAPAAFVVETGQRTVFDELGPLNRERSERIPRTRSPSTYPDMQAAAGSVADISVLKSGVVDGMAYSLYSDGSIEAQMPEGMMRFSSIDELREHLEQSSS